MGTDRQRTIASLCLLLAIGAVAAGAVLLRPQPAAAAGRGSRQFIFGPVLVSTGQQLVFTYSNTGTRPTPPGTVVFINAADGTVIGAPQPMLSMPPGQGSGGIIPGADQLVRAVVTFDRPAAGQGIPSPFAGTVQIQEFSVRFPPQVLAVSYRAL
jgi:hypothetical protein